MFWRKNLDLGYVCKLCRPTLMHTSKVNFHHNVSNFFPGIVPSSSNKNDCKEIYDKVIDARIIAPTGKGIYSLLPLGLRAIHKLNAVIDLQMKKINAKEILLPHLVSSSLWKKSERYDTSGPEIIKLQDRHNIEYILSPTHEEVVTKLVASMKLLQKSMPLRLYQISTKFRDEVRPKHGLMRGREFLMKDLYTFDCSEESALITYKEVSKAYVDLFEVLKLPVQVAKAHVGNIGGSISHEYHLISENGEDLILVCEKCNFCVNEELFLEKENKSCTNCGNTLKKKKGIEVGHTFHLGTKYSEPFSAFFMDENNNSKVTNMGCYGIGVSRLLMTALEYHSNKDSEDLLWPPSIAPYRVCLIPAKKGSKISKASSIWCQHFFNTISEIQGFQDEVLIDDRIKSTIGKRLVDMKKLGIPIIIVLGKNSDSSLVPKFELVDHFNNKTYEFSHLETLNFLKCYKF